MVTPLGPVVRLVTVTALVAAAVSLSSGVGSAEPTTPAGPTTVPEAQQQMIDLQHELEVVTEQYLDAVVARDQKQAEADEANQDLGVVQVQVEDLTEQIGGIASAAYQGQNMTSFSSFMTSDSPEEFLAKLNTLGAISENTNDALEELVVAQEKAAALSRTAEAALAAAATSAQESAEKKAYLEAEVPKLEAQLAALSGADRDAVMNAEFQGTGSIDIGQISAPTEAAKQAVEAAYSQLGVPYKWGGASPSEGFDCSGLTSWAYAQAGVTIPRTSQSQAGAGTFVPRDQVQGGDLVFFYDPISHVGIAIDNETMIHAPTTGDVVKVSSIDSNPSYTTARRYTG